PRHGTPHTSQALAHQVPRTAPSVHLTSNWWWSTLRRHLWQPGGRGLFRVGPEGGASSVGDTPSQHHPHWRSPFEIAMVEEGSKSCARNTHGCLTTPANVGVAIPRSPRLHLCAEQEPAMGSRLCLG